MVETKLECRTGDTLEFLKGLGYAKVGLQCPRFDSHKYFASSYMEDFILAKEYHSDNLKKWAIRAIAAQIFTGLRPEWVEANI